MPSEKFIDVAKRIARKDKAVFDTLIDFEKSGKIRTKERMNFTIDKATAARFKKFCREKGYNMSAKVENAIREMMDKEG